MTTDATPGNVPLSDLLGLDALRPVAQVQRMGSYQGVPALGCLLSIEAEKRLRVNDPLYDRAALLRVLDNAKAVQQHNAELLAQCERWRAWAEEAVNYVGCETWSPSLKEEGERLLGLKA